MAVRRLLPLLLTGLVVTACGGGGTTDTAAPEQDPLQVVQAAGDRVVEDGTSRLALQVDTSAQGVDVSVTGEGLLDYEAGTSEFTVTLPGSTDELTVRTLPDALFLRGLPGAPPDGWVRVGLDELSAGGGLGELGAFADPTSSFDQLRGVADDVTEVGSQDVRGTQATHYRGAFVIADVIEQAPAERRQALEQQLQPLRDAGVETLPFDAYVDDEGRLRRLTQTVTLDAAALGGGAPPGGAQPSGPIEVVTTIDVFDFGVEVDVQEPPADQVTEGLDGLLGEGAAPAPA